MKKFFGLVLFVLLAVPLMAQQVEVRDASTGESLPGALVSLTNPVSGKVRRGSTGGNGRCVLPVMDSVQVLDVRMSGYRIYRDTLAAGCAEKVCRLALSPDSLTEVVITAQYEAERPENAVQQVRIIDRARIDAQGAQNLRDLLSVELNIRLSQDPVLGSSMSIQGISGENVKIMINGVPVIGRQNGNIDLSQISLANVERVEIIEGPQSVSYGTNALAGVINLITTKKQPHTVSAGVDNFYESSGQYNTLFRSGIQHNKSIVLLSGGRNYFDGWTDGHRPFRMEQPRIADSSRYLQWKPRMQYSGAAQFIRYVDRGSFDISSDIFREKITSRGLPRAPYGETAFDDYFLTFRSSTTFSSRLRINDRNSFQAQAAYSHYSRTKNTYFRDLTTLDQQLSADASLQDTSVFRMWMLRSSLIHAGDSVKLKYELGIHFEYEDASGVRIRDGFRSIGDYAVFASAEYTPFTRLTIRPGLRWSYNTGYAGPPVPSLNVLLRMSERLKLRASYARGFRAPGLKELYFYFVDINHNIVGNENLLAEYSHNWMATLSWSRQQRAVTMKWQAGGFYNSVSNLITLALLEGVEYSYVNIGFSRTTGVNAGFDLRTANVQAGIAGTYVGRYNQLEDAGMQFSWSPEVRGTFLWKEKRSGITAGFFCKYTGKLPQLRSDAAGNIVQVYTGAYTIADCSLGKHFLKDKLALEIGCRNLLDVRAVNSTAAGSAHGSASASIPVANGRNYFFRLQLRVDFDKKETK